MNISSVVLHFSAGRGAEVRKALSAMPGIEIHAEDGAGRLIATIEDVGDARPADAFIRLHKVPGVLAVSLAYQYSDEGLEAEDGP